MARIGRNGLLPPHRRVPELYLSRNHGNCTRLDDDGRHDVGAHACQCSIPAGERPGTGAFMEELKASLKNEGLDIPVKGIKDAEPDKAVTLIKELDF